jgi:2-iminobutanoate/2-iminopropanoate deaminase
MKRTTVGKMQPGLAISSAVIVDKTMYLAGQVGVDEKGVLAGPDIRSQTAQALKNIAALLKEAGTSKDKVDTVTVYLIDRADFTGMNEVYTEFFTYNAPPGRTTVIVSALVRPEHRVEISSIAHL